MSRRPARIACLSIAMALPARAAPADFPHFDVEQSCTALVGTADPNAPMRNLCIKREQHAYDVSGRLWAASTAADRSKCIAVAEHSRSYKYVYLLTCLKSTQRQKDLSTPETFRY